MAMILGQFIEKFVEPNSIIRLVYKEKSGHKCVLKDWNDVGMEWEVLKCKGDNRHYINNEVIGLASIYTSGNYREAINIVIKELDNQPFYPEMKESTTTTTTNQ